MPAPSAIALGDNPSIQQLTDYVIKLQRDYEWLLLNLDDMNVRRLTADVLVAGTVDANVVTIRSDLTSGYIQIDGNGMTINNGSFDTFEADINGNVSMTSATIRNDLSGSSFIQIDDSGLRINNGGFDTFTADINGNVTMTRALIQSSPLGYPKIVMDPISEFFGAYQTGNRFLTIESVNYLASSPTAFWSDETSTAAIYLNSGIYNIVSGGSILMDSYGDISINPSGDLRVPSWTKIKNTSTLLSLQDALNEKARYGNATTNDGFHAHGIPNGTPLMVDGGGTVTFYADGLHSHSQT